MFLLAMLVAGAPVAAAQEPAGTHVAGSLALFPGVGVEVGLFSVESFFTREVNLIVDVRSFTSEGTVQVAPTLGGSIRLLGILRTVGGVAYRGLDLDTGLRVGPALSFRLKETHAFRNRRFNLFLEPFVRAATRRHGRIYFLELGAHRPYFRIGLWRRLGGGVIR